MAQRVKNLQAMQETWVQYLGQEDTLEKGMATNASVLAWRIPWTESLVGYSPWCHKVSVMTEPLTLSLLLQINGKIYCAHGLEELILLN